MYHIVNPLFAHFGAQKQYKINKMETNVSFMNMETNMIDSKQQRLLDKQRSLGLRLRLSREDLGWEQDDLGEKSGISRGYISKLERGYTTNVGIEVIFALANALGVSVQYLLGLTDDPLFGLKDDEEEELPAARLPAPDPLAEELLTVYQQLDPPQRTTLLNIAKVLKTADEPRIIGGS